MNDPALSIPKLNPAVVIKTPTQRGYTALRTRVFLDAQSLQRIDAIRLFVENELGASLSTSMVIRLALRVWLRASPPTPLAGLSIADVGVSDYTATGSVYNLKKPEDIEGTYAAVTAGATVAGGVSGAAMRNQNGVLIQLSATREGLQFTLAPAGIKISLVK